MAKSKDTLIKQKISSNNGSVNTAPSTDEGPDWLKELTRKKALVGRKITMNDELKSLCDEIKIYENKAYADLDSLKDHEKFFKGMNVSLMMLSDYVFNEDVSKEQKINAIKDFVKEFKANIKKGLGKELDDEKLYLLINKFSENLKNDQIGYLFEYLYDNITGKGNLEDFKSR
jgi:hypothetical protein